MDLPLSESVAEHLAQVDEIGSTNDELVARAESEPDFSVLVTSSQTAGRGRLGRVWVAPPGKTLAISVLVRPRLPTGEPLSLEHFGWLPLIAGAAMSAAVASVLPGDRVRLKWPNDVQVGGLKISGLLAELLPTADGAVLGAGINLTMTRDDLPTPTSTSLALEGATEVGDALADAVLSTYLATLRRLYDDFLRAGADADASGARDTIVELCATLGREVRVELPGGDDLFGVATGIDGAGRLLVTGTADGRVTAVAAGDVTHLRYE
jgi:BirA family biotin operon repressor/biotin-[acetyl-CoA-carboxylase] ligase